jgi:predicted aspartyl protease
MIDGIVTEDGDPVITLNVGGRDWPALIDTGFNGDLQLPEDCRGSIPLTLAGRVSSILANNDVIEEDTYLTTIPFDGEVVIPTVTFVVGNEVLIGTNFLCGHRLIIDFVMRTVRLERVQTP